LCRAKLSGVVGPAVPEVPEVSELETAEVDGEVGSARREGGRARARRIGDGGGVVGRSKVFCAVAQESDVNPGAGHEVREVREKGAEEAGRGADSRRTQPGGGRGRGGADGRLNKNEGRESNRIGAGVVRAYDCGRLRMLLRFSG
jgi:hypothetical protein